MENYISYIRKFMGKNPVIFSGAGLFVFNNKKELLMIHRTDNNTWAIPGGYLELGERMEDAAVRELYEETGLRAESLKLLNIYSGKELYQMYPNGDEVYIVVAIYTVTEYSGTLKHDNIESDDVKFFPLNALPDKLNPPDIFVLNDLLTNQIDNIII
jgi:8-oxo-dGTP pyrophosphatase MutT (NUDIX family)